MNIMFTWPVNPVNGVFKHYYYYMHATDASDVIICASSPIRYVYTYLYMQFVDARWPPYSYYLCKHHETTII